MSFAWPAELFAVEAERVLGRAGLGPEAANLLLPEAIRDGNAVQDLASRQAGPVRLRSGSSCAG